MPPKESLYPKDWFRIAEKDFRRAQQLLKLEDPEGAAYNLQQATEKYLKGFLLAKGWHLKRIHDLEVLLNDALKYEASLEEFREVCQKITNYYFLNRYPLATSVALTAKQVRGSLDQARKFIGRLKGLTK
ncbi:MAG: HEPN domain-containing protein [Deltaproteobacteria bacterium]|nr:HEPN domain-containing protein [Deltaproteobacteria bacterium]